MQLFRSNVSVPTVFDLLGSSENDMTASLAYVLAESPELLRLLMKDLGAKPTSSIDKGVIRIQTSRRDHGITDVEIEVGTSFFSIIEAKSGPILPALAQLRCYAPILSKHLAGDRYLVTVSNATKNYAHYHLGVSDIEGIPVVHRSWRQIQQLVAMARPSESNANKRVLDDFSQYLGQLLGMEMKYSNLVFVVSLTGGNPKGWSISWIDIVEKKHRYFYPIGPRWPDPPNYMGFRYDGQLRSIRHVESISIFENPREAFPEAADEHWGPHYCLALGPKIVPSHEVRNGPRIRQANRCWCAIDLLLTENTISDALTKTQSRDKK